MHLFLDWAKLYQSELMQAHVEAEVNNTDIAHKSLIRHMNVAWKIEFGGEGVMQTGEGEVELMNIEFKGGKYGHKQNKCPKKNKPKKGKGNKKFSGTCNHCSKVRCKAANCWEHKQIKTRGPRIGRRKKTRK